VGLSRDKRYYLLLAAKYLQEICFIKNYFKSIGSPTNGTCWILCQPISTTRIVKHMITEQLYDFFVIKNFHANSTLILFVYMSKRFMIYSFGRYRFVNEYRVYPRIEIDANFKGELIDSFSFGFFP
jgi:hypothetical protein